MTNNEKLYKAMVWDDDESPGQRVSTYAENLAEALIKLESEYGKGNVLGLFNEEEANRIR